MKETLRLMLTEFFIILSGITICSAIFCTVFNPDVMLRVDFLWQAIALAFLTSLPQIIFYSKKELFKKQLIARQAIHFVLVAGLLLYFAYTWVWVRLNSLAEPLVFIAMVLLVYFCISWFMYHREKKLAKLLNEKLQKFKERKED